MKIKNLNKLILYFFFSFYLFIGIYTLNDYGVNIEEHTQFYSGFYWLNYIFEFFEINSFKDIILENLNTISKDKDLPNPEIYTYGPVFDVPLAFIDVILKNDESNYFFKYRHFGVFIIFYFSSIIFFKIVLQRFNNFFVSLFGTSLYIFSPRIYGDSFHNNKDIIFLSMVVFAIYFAFKIFKKKKIKYIILFSLVASLATSTRIIGIFLPVSVILFLFLELLNFKYKNNLKVIVIIFFLYILFLILHWPYLWESPIENFIKFILRSKEWVFSYYILFNGKYYLTTNLPDSFVFTWIGISSPILNLFLFMCGFYILVRRLFLRFITIDPSKEFHCDFWRSKKEMKDNFIIFNFISIMSILIFLNVSLASGWRHLYFLNFFITYIAIFFLNICFTKLTKYKAKLSLILFLLLIPNIYKLIIFHPYQSLYLNEILNNEKKNSFLIDREGLTRLDSIKKILSLENKKKKINIGNASFIPYYRIKDVLPINEKKRINFVGREFDQADYIYNNFVYEINPKFNNKYQIPSNFKKIYELEINGIKMYEIWKKG